MQYFCKNQQRRLKVGADTNTRVNGIDYLEVLDNQITLQVHFLQPLPGQNNGVPQGTQYALRKENILIEGGVRKKNIEVNEDKDIEVSNEVLTLEVNHPGDFSFYTLRLITSPTDPTPPEGFDPHLSSIDFSFKIHCPSDFDCKPEFERRPPAGIDPRIDYLAKDYASFRRLILDRLSLLMPQWQERNAADLQIALVELMAYTGDYLSYYQDAVATEAYLFKARKRISVKRHARLLDYPMRDGCNARVWVAIAVEKNSPADNAELEKGTVLLTKGMSGEIYISPDELPKKLREKKVHVFETMHSVELNSIRNEIYFYTWDDADCCLPKGATRATLYGENHQALNFNPGDVLIFEEIKNPGTGISADANPNHRHAVRLTKIEETTDPLHDLQVVNVEWHGEDALPFALCVHRTINGVEHKNISVARGNVVLADHGRTVEAESLVPAAAPETEPYWPFLPDTGITVAEPYVPDEQNARSAGRALLQDPHAAIPQIALYEGGNIWRARRDLLSSDRFQKEFVPEMEADRSVRLRFGNDVLGKKPGPGFRPRARYRIGNGLAGNVGSDTIGRIVWDKDGIRNVRNPLPAGGGKGPETMEEVRQFAPMAFRQQARAVTEADYAEKTELHPQVQKAFAQFKWTGSWYTVFLTIDRKNGLPVTEEFKRELYTHLEKYRMTGYDLELRSPEFVPLDIRLNIYVQPGYFRSNIRSKLLTVFSRFDLPDGTRGFFHPDEFTFGQPLYLSAVYQRALMVEGVASVEVQTFQRWGRTAGQEKENGRLMPAISEIIRLDNDPNFPENGRIDFQLFGGV